MFFFNLILTLVCAANSVAGQKIVNAVGCSLFNRDGKLLKKYDGWVCGFFPNGKMLLGNGRSLIFYDEKMREVWNRPGHTHHMITYVPEDDTATVIASRIIGGDTRADRLEVFDSSGRLKKSFDFDESHSVYRQAQNWDSSVLPNIKWCITLIESFYRIGKNSSKLPYFREGNYLAYDAAGVLYFFNRDLTKIIHQKKVAEWGLRALRDVQVTPQGSLLFYNSGNRKNGTKFTSLDELDPETGKVKWSFKGDPPDSIYGSYEGNVQLLPSGNFLFSVVMDEFKGAERREVPAQEWEPWKEIQGMHRSFEVTRKGKIVWKMVNDGSGLSGMPNVVKRLDLSAYYQRKKKF